MTSPEGQQYRNFYPVDSLPHIALIDPRTGLDLVDVLFLRLVLGERVKTWPYAPKAAEFLIECTLAQ